MRSTPRKLDTQQATSLAGAALSTPDGGFKRLALPAVAAAVQTLKWAKQPELTSPERPAVRRREGKLS